METAEEQRGSGLGRGLDCRVGQEDNKRLFQQTLDQTLPPANQRSLRSAANQRSLRSRATVLALSTQDLTRDAFQEIDKKSEFFSFSFLYFIYKRTLYMYIFIKPELLTFYQHFVQNSFICKG